ncbi:hypothetical protein BV25DRAFT_123640 [Artomyces pyxidatus]|uniref:Uncharacterized protein n=1 Tax=Artomyces pyxidatus TaxID=48021 RepID=A0ACB8TLJ8_9AGAM|nr:hypothetical protein BV25DRAFT_123640 [Artomyces pyxidatus]
MRNGTAPPGYRRRRFQKTTSYARITYVPVSAPSRYTALRQLRVDCSATTRGFVLRRQLRKRSQKSVMQSKETIRAYRTFIEIALGCKYHPSRKPSGCLECTRVGRREGQCNKLTLLMMSMAT